MLDCSSHLQQTAIDQSKMDNHIWLDKMEGRERLNTACCAILDGLGQQSS